MNIVVALIVILVVGRLVIKRYKPQPILLIGGLVMMAMAYFLGYATEFVPAKKATGLLLFDMFEYINQTTMTDVAGLGLMIMAVTGFAKYMDRIGASSALVQLTMKPLGRLKAPYVILSLSFLLCMFMALFIPSASGLAMLMMVTVFPILTQLGVSRAGAASAVATGHLLDIGPASATSLLVSKTAGISVNQYFVEYQLTVYIICGICVAIAHFFWQSYLDRKEANKAQPEGEADLEKAGSKVVPPGPLVYVLLPLLPLVFLLAFSEYGIASIKMNVVLAMFLSLTVSMLFELIRLRDFREVCSSTTTFFKGMGDQFAMTVTLIVAGETFAFGIKSLGVVNAMIDASKSMEIGVLVITLAIVAVIIGFSIVMGSGVAPMFGFSPLIPGIAAGIGANATTMLLAMQNAASLGRLFSPISAVMIAVSGIANISPIELVKRNSVPVLVGVVVSTISIFILHH